MVDVRGLDPRFAPSCRLSAVRFLCYTGEDIKRISCKKITNVNTFDSLLHPNAGGLYDSALGPSDKQDLCGTCGLNYVHCPGHVGHIPLPLPVYHPIFFMTLYQVFRGSCWNCHRLLCPPYKEHLLIGQLRLLECGLLSEAHGLESAISSATIGEEDVDSIVHIISQHIEKCRRIAGSDSGSTQKKTKNLVESKQLLVSEFLRSCGSLLKTCPGCSAPVRTVRQEQRVRVFLKPLARKHAAAWVTARRREVAQREALKNALDKDTEAESEEDDVSALVDEMSHEGGKQEHRKANECLKQSYITPLEAREHTREMWKNHKALMDGIFGGSESSVRSCEGDESVLNPADMFFLSVVPVPPSRFRPIAQFGEKRFENPQTVNLHKILVDCIAIHELMAERRGAGLEAEGRRQRTKATLSFSERLQAAWVRLQMSVNCFMDSSTDKKGGSPNGIKQILEKKEGLFRKHMMGKRVDYAARSVISPDPYINMDEIGIPLVFATKLTYPQPVTHWNVNELRQAVINGPNTHPGATHVQNEDGAVVLLSANNPRQRSSIAKKLLTPSKDGLLGGPTKKVYRHLKDGDVLLMNRQPTLHRPSIMAHKARVLPGEKTLRLHYANCKSYNADFDGDEMNAHFPQNELARAEAYNIVSTHQQYLVPKDGTPLSGLIQDHVVSGLLMTIRGRSFHRSDYQHLVFSALPRFPGCFKLLPPCIMKPQRLWSGKQVVSTVLLNIIPEGQAKLNLVSRAKIADKEWGRGAVKSDKDRKKRKKRARFYRDDVMTESEVVFCQGELLCGVLDKSQFGASQFGFVHTCHELYGGVVSNLLLSALGRLYTTFLHLRGFSLGVEDILVTPQADEERRRVIEESKQCGPSAAAEALSLADPSDTALLNDKYEAAHRSVDGVGIKALDYFVKKKTDHFNNLINAACVPAGLHKPFPSNCLQLMVQSGAKGSTVNCMQISSLLGQIELEGKRPPLMCSGRFLPSFLPYDTSPRAGGFVAGRFLTGIRPQEYFFHCMAGREGLVDTAVKTSRSGYLQRCLIKHLEGICVGYDLTVRDSDGSLVQFLYGEDGMDICKTSFLTEKQFPFLINNHQALLYRLNPDSAASSLDTAKASKYQHKFDRWVRRHGPPGSQPRPAETAFLNFCEKHLPELVDRFPDQTRTTKFHHRTQAELEVIDLWYGMSPMARRSYNKKFSRCPDPINAHLSPDRHFGSVSEQLSQHIDAFIDSNAHSSLDTDSEEQGSDSGKLSAEKFASLLKFQCLRALCDPGEAVGLLAAQSIGEPSTQMTLNTFHFAGRGEMNVTLGIPRLREILMTASPNIKTPAMDVPLLPLPSAHDKGEQLKKQFTRVCLSEVLEKVEVWETLSRQGKGHCYRLYRVRLAFLPERYYAREFAVTPSLILRYVERVFIKKLVAAINKEFKLVKDRRLKSVTVERESFPGSTSAGQQEDDPQAPPDDDDDDTMELSEVEGDSDATATRLKSKKQQHASYEDAGESDHEAIGSHEDSDSDLSGDDTAAAAAASGGVKSKAYHSDEEEDDVQSLLSPASSSSAPTGEAGGAMDMDRIQEAIHSSSAATGYSYDVERELWCEITLRFPLRDSKVMVTSVIEKLAPKVVVRETPHIRKGYMSESTEPGEGGVWRLKTDGVNLQVLWQHADVLDLSKVYTNNIHAMANTYGIEAACKAIIKEISGVFKVYGIAVDYRHLSLIADYMTFEGFYKPFNRIGMETNSSPFQKMSFETTMHFLKSAAVASDVDSLQSPSACLVAGRVVHGGTGCCELLQTLT